MNSTEKAFSLIKLTIIPTNLLIDPQNPPESNRDIIVNSSLLKIIGSIGIGIITYASSQDEYLSLLVATTTTGLNALDMITSVYRGLNNTRKSSRPKSKSRWK